MWLGDGSVAATPQQKLSTKGMRRIVQVVDDRVLVFDPPEENPIAQYSKTIIAGGRKQKDMRYAFDRVFDETCTQEDVPSPPALTKRLMRQVFTHTAKPLLDGVLDGFNATVFAYGATGCGKTHTIRFIPGQVGIFVDRTVEHQRTQV
jgi:kinesin family member 18/19